MVVSKTQIYTVLITACILLQGRFFHILNASQNLTIVLCFCIILAFLVAITDKNASASKWSLQYIILVFLVVVLPQTAYAFVQGETIEGYVDTIRGILNILLLVPILKLINRKQEIHELLDTIMVLTTISLFLLLLNSFFLNNFNIQLMPFEYYARPSTARWNRLRLFLISDFTAFVSIYSFCRYLNKTTRNIRYLVSFLICLITEIYVEQTRMLYMAIMASCILIYARSLKSRKPIFYFLSAIIAVFGMLGDWFSSFIDIFSVHNETLGISTMIRLREYEYAFETIRAHPFLGSGMVSQYLYDVTIDGFRFQYNHTDIGIIGCITYIGLIGTIVLFIAPYIRMIKTLRVCPYNERDSFEYNFLFGLCVFIGITSFTILITDNARIFVWPFILALNEYVRRRWLDGNIE